MYPLIPRSLFANPLESEEHTLRTAVIDVRYRQPWTVIEPTEDPNLYINKCSYKPQSKEGIDVPLPVTSPKTTELSDKHVSKILIIASMETGSKIRA